MRRYALLALGALVGAVVATPLAVYASHRFTDVPNNHTFHNAIDWMADNGITVGCNPPANNQYCPDEAVTRAQMSAFMKRLAENRVVDADRLDGLDGASYRSLAWSSHLDNGTHGFGNIPGFPSRVLDLDIDAPAAGALLLNFSLGVLRDIGFSGVAWLQYDDAACDPSRRIEGTFVTVEASGAHLNDDMEHVSSSIVVPTTPGDHTITLCAVIVENAPALRTDAAIVAQFTGEG
jgi:hypothetical protein